MARPPQCGPAGRTEAASERRLRNGHAVALHFIDHMPEKGGQHDRPTDQGCGRRYFVQDQPHPERRQRNFERSQQAGVGRRKLRVEAV